jgi:hypothetical protein
MDEILPEASGTKSKSPTKRISISPTRAPVTPNRENGHLGLFLSMSRSPSRPSLSPVRDPDNLDSFLSIAAPILTEGQSSDSAILIPDSPEKQPRQSAFVPFVREPMKVQAPRNPPVDRGQSARYDAYPESRRKGKSKAALVESIEVDCQKRREGDQRMDSGSQPTKCTRLSRLMRRWRKFTSMKRSGKAERVKTRMMSGIVSGFDSWIKYIVYSMHRTKPL